MIVWASGVLRIIYQHMNKQEIFDRCREAVQSVTGITYNKMMLTRNEEAVNARMLLIRHLADYGFTESEIAEYTYMKQQRINYLKNEALKRIAHNRLMRVMYDEVERMMEG
jgi:hypothetical protein